MMTHLTWSIEVGDSRCPECNDETILIVAPSQWYTADGEADPVEVYEEVTGHYCQKCGKLVSLSLNTEV